MPDIRPAIPADTQLIVRTRAGHKCSVDGETSALEIAHIIDWAASHDHAPENLLLLCANCHTRSHKEKWSRKTLRYYRDHPFVTRGDARAYRPTRLPYPSLGPLFKGREDFLIDLHTSLEINTAPAIRGHTVHGMGGVGKTRAAVEYAWRFAGEYSALLFVEADSPESLSRNIAALCVANTLDLPQQHEPEQTKQEQAVMRWLQTHPGWLLIIDNADTKEALVAVEDRLAQLRDGHVIITTRRTNCSGSFKSLDLDALTQEDAADFLLARTEGHRTTTPDDDALALQLAGLLDGLALALEQAAAYIREFRLSLADYINRWQTVLAEALAWHDEATMHYPRSLAITYQTSVDQLSEPAREFFQILSWFAPDPIPFFVLGSEHAPASARPLLAEIENLSLAQRNEDGSAFTIHRLVQEITRQQQVALPPPPGLVTALDWISGLFVGDSQNVSDWPVLDPLASHARTIAFHAIAHTILEPSGLLLNNVALLCATRAQYAEAESFYRLAVGSAEIIYGECHPQLAIRLDNLAEVLRMTNHLPEAEQIYRRALSIVESCLGKDHLDVAIILSNLALLLQATNRLAEAEPLLRRSLEISEAALGTEHPKIANGLNNLGYLLKVSNRFEEAEPLYRRALAIDEAHHGKDHPFTANRLNNLAKLLHATNRSAEAEPLMRRALVINEAAFGSTHPNVAHSLNNLSQLLHATNRSAEAEPLILRSIAITEAVFGPEHPNLAHGLSNLAKLLLDTGRLVEAEPPMRRAFDIWENSPGKDHPIVVNNSRNLAKLLHRTNRFAEAEQLMRQILDISEASLGPEHPDVAIDLNNLATLLKDTNRLPEAEPLMRRALAIDETAFGPNDDKVALRLNSLSLLLHATNRPAEAEPLMRRMLGILVDLTRATGRAHPYLQTGTKQYGCLLKDMGEPQANADEQITKILEPIRGIIP